MPPGATVRVAFSTLVAPSREEALDLADKYHDPATFERAATLAWTQAQVQLHHLGIAPDEAHLFQRLASRVLYSDPTLRPAGGRARAQQLGGPPRSGRTASRATCRSCWSASTRPTTSSIVRQLLRAHEYWRMKQLAVDLVILNERAPSYAQDLQASLETLVRTSQSAGRHEGARRRAAASSSLRADRITPPQRDAAPDGGARGAARAAAAPSPSR